MVGRIVVARPEGALAGSARMVVGADLGGSKLAAVLVDGSRSVVHRIWWDHAGLPFGDLLTELEAAVAECQDVARERGGEVAALGLSVAAWLSRDRELVVRGVNIGARQHRLGDELRRRFDFPVVVDNDGNAAALAEYRAGGASARCLVLFALGTGVGGGVVVDGRPLVGASGLAGELGHMPVMDDGPPCVCGGRGCLELFASGPAIARAAGAPTSFEVVAAADAGDAGARAVLAAAGWAVGKAVALLVPVVEPDVVVLAGSLAHAGRDHVLPAVRSAVAQLRPLSDVIEPPLVELGRLGQDAGAIGAAELVWEAAPGPPSPLHPGPYHPGPYHPGRDYAGPGYPEAGYAGPGDPGPGYPEAGYAGPGDPGPGRQRAVEARRP